MDLKSEALYEIEATAKFFNRSTRCLAEEDSGFRPTPEMMTVAGQVAHAAQTIDWFREGGFSDNWQMDFEAAIAETAKITSLATARTWMADSWERLRQAVEASSNEELAAILPDNPILEGRPRYHTIEAIVDHTGHHRGALSVYARLLGKTPDMPYGED